MNFDSLLLGVDGGGTRCRARLRDISGKLLGNAVAGPANIRFGLEASINAALEATLRCLTQSGLSKKDLDRIVACLAFAGASEPSCLAAAQNYEYPFRRSIITTDAHAACIGAHGGRDGGVVVVGTGTVGWAELEGRVHRIGGWGLPVSDEGSGAWLGMEALRNVLLAHDCRRVWTPLLRRLFEKFQSDPHAIVRFVFNATPREYASFALLVIEHAARQDVAAVELLQRSASHLDDLVMRLAQVGADRIALVGGLAASIEEWLAPQSHRYLVSPVGDALDGALSLARIAAETPTVPDLLDKPMTKIISDRNAERCL